MKKLLFATLIALSAPSMADYKISFSNNLAIPEKSGVDLSKIKNLATGYGHSVVIKEDGSLYSWGRNEFQQTLVPQGNNFEKIVAGNNHTIASDSNGVLYQWGRDVGEGANFTYSGNFKEIAATALSFFALDENGYFNGFGYASYLPENSVVENKKFKIISSGYYNGALVDENNNIYVFGQNDSSLQKTNAPSTMDLKKLDGGFNYFAGIKADGSIYVWGDNTDNQVSEVPEGNDFVDISAGVHHVLALRSDGTLESWGRDSKGQVSKTPDEDGFVAISAGGEFSLALKDDGSLVVWGDDSYNQILDAPDDEK